MSLCFDAYVIFKSISPSENATCVPCCISGVMALLDLEVFDYWRENLVLSWSTRED